MDQLHEHIVILDGAMGSELERCGSDTSLPLWSARALIDAPHLVEEVHCRALDAGATWITTNTFRTHARSLARAGYGDRADSLTRLAVELAQRARDRVNPMALVCGSVAPLEDCYRPELAPDAQACADEHGAMIDTLVDAGVDLLLIETMNNATEARAAAAHASTRMPDRYVLSVCARHDVVRRPQLLSGEKLIPLFKSVERAYAVGVNCVPAPSIAPIVRSLRSALPEYRRVIAYANVGEPDDQQGWRNTDAVDPARYAAYAIEWIEAGASIVGGCCGTTPVTIRATRDAIKRRVNASAPLL